MCCWLMLLFVAWPSAAFAQAELSSAQARTVQYVFVIDDSGSMSKHTSGGEAADPDRLSVFAVRSLLSMLDDADEATVVRLNGPDAQDTPPPIGPLSSNRTSLVRALELDGKLAQYAGQQTPCASALDHVQRALNQSWRPNVAQVVFFLTDGECTGELPQPAAYLKGVNSHQEGLFRFYLLRFSGRQYTRALERMAGLTDGQASEVSAVDPTTILKPFASALSRSQGYEAYLLTPSRNTLDAHLGARRVRLLAVAPDKGQPLSFQINNTRQGKAPERIGQERAGVHQYASGRRFRYVALDYKPGTSPISVSVKGAGNDWKIVAVPEYRLFVELELQDKECGQGGQPVQFVEVGGRVCAIAKLVNEEGQLVSESIASRGMDASVRYIQPGIKEPSELPLNRQGNQASFTLERVNLERGDHIFYPTMHIPVPGTTDTFVTLKGAARTLQVSSRSVSPVPARFDLGELVPGEERYLELKLQGNFPPTRARHVVEGRRQVPECVTFELSGVKEDQAQKITPSQTYTLGVKVAPYCGHASSSRDINTAIRLEFDKAASSRSVPSVLLPMTFSLVNRLDLPKTIISKIEGGSHEDVSVTLGGNHKQELTFKALIPPRQERQGWPGDELDVHFVDEDGKVIIDAQTGQPATTRDITFSRGADAAKGSQGRLTLRIDSDACCVEGKYRTELALIPTAGSREVIRVPIQVQVVSAGAWRCYGPMILYSLGGLLLLLLLLYIFNMFRQSDFLNRDMVASKLVPLRWDDWNEPSPHSRGAEDVKRMIRKGMPWYRRALSWLRANPFIFGLPGRAYHETVQLYLEPARDVSRSRVTLLAERDLYHQIATKPEEGSGRIFCTARGGALFFCVPDRDKRLGRLQYNDEFGGFDDGGWDDEASQDGPKLEVVRLRREELLDINAEREPETAAGWRVG